ncbi:MAG: hypothetical protein EBZ36_04125 [Acidobacteria bacterium]|nr:hypothetical protein [Acidobacteriota bacterium]
MNGGTRLLSTICLMISLTILTLAQSSGSFDRLEWRSIGPAIFAGRVTDVEGVPGNPKIVYVASASGGLWKTVNGGVTWRPIFERQGTISLGDIAIDPGNPEVIWAGTGEGNPRNSVSFGDGIYRSRDGGQSWEHLGLRETRFITRILIHPRNPDVVFVGALGHVFGPNAERGVFVTYDGGRTWQKTLYLDPEHGVADLDIDPVNPNIVYAAMWRFERKPWNFVSGSEKGGIYKSIDGGRTWKKLSQGLPKLVGRIGVKAAPSNPNIVYAITESKEGTLYRSDDKGETFRLMSKQTDIVSRGFYYTDLRVDPRNENRIYSISSPLFLSIDGGRTHRPIAPRIHIDYHSMWIDPQNPERIWVGNDGGVAVSYDQGESWENVNNLPLAQPYHVFADQSLPFYQVMGGMQDNGSWTGPGRTREPAGILNDDWRMVSFGDGFKVINHPDNPDLYLSLSQGGNVVLTDMRTREQQLVKPWVGGTGGAASNQKYRFHWNSPLVFSPHGRSTVYLGGNLVFKSTDFGRTWTRISDDLTTADPEKLKDAGGPIATENTTAEYHCTIISINESPVRAGMIWAGTDDGNLQLTNDGGRNWSNITGNVSGLPGGSSVSHVEPSMVSADVAYVSFDRHMLNDYRPYVFKTVDGGKSFVNITGNLPENGYVHVLKEDPRNPGLLYAGTELGLFATYDNGLSWIELGLKNLPRVAVHDIVVHPRDNDIILATHGRGFWIFDDASVIQQSLPDLLKQSVHLFEPRPTLRFTTRFTRYGIGDKQFAGPNPPAGALLTYYLKEKPDPKTRVAIQIIDQSGRLVRELGSIPQEPGFNRTTWDLGEEGSARRRTTTSSERAEMFGGGGPRGPLVLPGAYTIRLIVGDQIVEKKIKVELDPLVKTPPSALQEQYDASVRLRNVISEANRRLRVLDGIKEQLQQVERTVREQIPDAPTELRQAIEAELKATDEMIGKLASPSAEGLGYRGTSRVVEQLGSLFGSIQGVNAGPTLAQKEVLEEIVPQATDLIRTIEKDYTERVTRLNELLKKSNAPVIVVARVK